MTPHQIYELSVPLVLVYSPDDPRFLCAVCGNMANRRRWYHVEFPAGRAIRITVSPSDYGVPLDAYQQDLTLDPLGRRPSSACACPLIARCYRSTKSE